jgi:hypothetical protein
MLAVVSKVSTRKFGKIDPFQIAAPHWRFSAITPRQACNFESKATAHHALCNPRENVFVLQPSHPGPMLLFCQFEIAMTPTDRRFARQFEVLSRLIPRMRGTITFLRAKKWLVIRLPLALLLIFGGIFSFLPILGIWMLPLGLLLLAVDLPPLRGPISNLMIRVRRRIDLWSQRRRARKRP